MQVTATWPNGAKQVKIAVDGKLYTIMIYADGSIVEGAVRAANGRVQLGYKHSDVVAAYKAAQNIDA